MLTVVTTCPKDYARAWVFPTLARLTGCRVVCLLAAGDARPLPESAERVVWADGYAGFHQHGAFLDSVPGVADDDVVVLCDADAAFQRDFAAHERATLSYLSEGFALGYNLCPGQRGETEHALLLPKQPLPRTAEALGLPQEGLRDCRCYNTGLVAGRAHAWRRLASLYRQTFPAGGNALFGSRAWQQYFLCVLLHRHQLPVAELGYETHSHGHFPHRRTASHAVRGGVLYYGDRPVLFAHFWAGVNYAG